MLGDRYRHESDGPCPQDSYYLHVDREISQLQHAVVNSKHKVKLALEAKIKSI